MTSAPIDPRTEAYAGRYPSSSEPTSRVKSKDDWLDTLISLLRRAPA